MSMCHMSMFCGDFWSKGVFLKFLKKNFAFGCRPYFFLLFFLFLFLLFITNPPAAASQKVFFFLPFAGFKINAVLNIIS